MYCVGLTGNIASGKSTAIAYFQARNIAVIIADNIAYQLTTTNQPALHGIIEHFGKEMITKTGELDRRLLRTIIFKHPEERLWLEQLLHPLIKVAIQKKIDGFSSTPYCVIEIPLLTARNDYPYLERILVLLADKSTQIQRVMLRDNCDEEHALAILAAQPSDNARRDLADDLIINNGSIEQLNHHILQLHKQYLQFAHEKSSLDKTT